MYFLDKVHFQKIIIKNCFRKQKIGTIFFSFSISTFRRHFITEVRIFTFLKSPYDVPSTLKSLYPNVNTYTVTCICLLYCILYICTYWIPPPRLLASVKSTNPPHNWMSEWMNEWMNKWSIDWLGNKEDIWRFYSRQATIRWGKGEQAYWWDSRNVFYAYFIIIGWILFHSTISLYTSTLLFIDESTRMRCSAESGNIISCCNASQSITHNKDIFKLQR